MKTYREGETMYGQESQREMWKLKGGPTFNYRLPSVAEVRDT